MAGQPPRFVRGDANSDYTLDISDAVLILTHLFLGKPQELDCDDASDCNDDGTINIADPLFLLFYLFEGNPKELPFPFQHCGIDPTPEDLLGCGSHWACGTGPFVNSVSIKMLAVAPGTFLMGSPSTERGRFPDEFQHEVVISCPFYMSETEITQGQYLEVMGTNPSHWNGKLPDYDYGVNLMRCVESVTWYDAMEFCWTLSQKEGRRYRLPYEAEWEYACRAGTQSRFSFGDALECFDDFCPITSDPACLCPLAGQFMHWPDYGELPYAFVKSRDPNSWGLFGMHDIMAEWCMDWYGPYPKTGVLIDPKGPQEGFRKVVRGWVMHPFGLRISRSAYRSNNRLPSESNFDLGFRIVAETPECSYGQD